MAYTAPTAAEFKARFPVFADVLNATIDAVIAEGQLYVDNSWREVDYKPALMYWTAHMLASEGALNPAGAPAAAAVAGQITSESLGDASTSYGSSSSTGRSGADADFDTTPYGKRFLQIRDGNFRGPVLVS